VDELVERDQRGALDALPASVPLLGDRAALTYELENGQGVVTLRVREGQARRLRSRDLPVVDRPLRFEVARRDGQGMRATSLEDLRRLVSARRARVDTRRRRRRR